MKKILFIPLLLAVASAQPVAAQNNGSGAVALEEIIVTARKKEESLQTIPLAVSAASRAQLEAQGIDSFDEVLSTIPNASQSGGIAGGLQGLISIRGISTLVRFVGLETGVGFYVDGVFTGRPENFNQDLIDIERVEVLRGPQGAVFGKNTVAGAINIITQNPDDDFKASIEAQYGNFNQVRTRGYVSGPLIPGKLAGSFSAGHVNHDGFVENISGIGPDLDAVNLTTFRGKLRFTPSERTEFILSADTLIDRGEPAFFEVADASFIDDPSEATPFTVNQDQPSFLDRDITGLSFTSNVDLGGGTWSTVLGYRDSSFDAGLDDDKLPVRFFVDFFASDTEFFSAETRYSGSIGERANYLVGAYYFTQEAGNVSNFALGDFLTGVPGVEPPIDLTSSVDTDSIALFFNTDIALSEQLSLEVGGRFVTEEKDAIHIQDDQTGLFGSTNFSASRRDNDFSPTVALSYQLNEGTIIYGRFAEGFKSAGFNTDFITATSNLEVDPEDATSFEIGYKSDLFNNRLRLNVAAFFTDYEDLQLSQIADGGVTLTNASSAEIYGVETEFTAAVHQYVQIDGSAGYLNATYEDFTGCPVPGAETGPVSDNCAGNFLNLAPEWTAKIGAQFTYPYGNIGDIVVRADWNYRSQVFFEPQNSERLSGGERDLVNLRAGLVNEGWELFLWADNLLDEVYVNFSDDRSAIFVNTTQAFGATRTFGGTVRLRF